MNKLRALIIDDEKHCIETLQWQLEQYCPEIELVQSCNGAGEGIEAIQKHLPDVVFLDIEMPGMNGFELIESLNDIRFSIIFTTAYDQFAIKAFKVSALDYLVKPVDDDDLKSAVQKALENRELKSTQLAPIHHLIDQLKSKKLADRVVFPTLDGLEFVETKHIVHCESSSNYTTVYFEDSSKMVISKTLKDVEEMLFSEQFFRVHNSHLVNLSFVKKYVRGDGGHLVLKDGTTISVSRSRKQDLLNYLQI